MIDLQPPAAVGTEHLLLGVISVRKSVARQILGALDVDTATIRAEVLRALGH